MGANNAKTKQSLEKRQTKNAAYELNKIDNAKLKSGILQKLSLDFQTMAETTKGKKIVIFQTVNIGRLKKVLDEMEKENLIDWIDNDIPFLIKIRIKE